MGIFFVMIFSGIISCTGQKTNNEIFEAYKQRINGQADSAQILLQQIVNENPDNALAWYELCRTTQQLGLANPREIKEALDEALICIDKAVELDPENALYLSYKGKIETLHFYMGMTMGDENAAAYLDKFEKSYNSVFQMDPSYTEDKLTLVEFFGGLPPDMGGDAEKAEKYAKELEAADVIAGAKARELLMPEDADYVAFWEEIVKENPENAAALQALGRIYLFMEDIDQATIYYQKAIDLDPLKNALYLDLGRYYMMGAIRDPAVLDSLAPMIEEQFIIYLNSTPEPINPMKAWTYGTLSMINRRLDNQQKADTFMVKANELDPFRSFASAKPGRAIYCPPDEVVHEQGYYLSPF
jgi:tetratricopeptide (TPR) repeat protein